MSKLTEWIGRSETLSDLVTPAPVRALAATLDRDPEPVAAGTPLPPLWHWLYFLPMHRQSEIGPDGHARRGGFLPPVPLPRRMWAGSQFEFRSPVRVGDEVSRTSTIADVIEKEGRTGKLVFVKVRHELRCNGAAEAAIVEFHDIVYREAKRPADGDPPPVKAPSLDDMGSADSGSGSPGPESRPLGGQRPQGAWGRTIVPDDVLLFRYSALTFNGHRIHYDRKYVTEVEGYPGLIVHGPLIATLLMDLLRRQMPDAEVAAFRFKAVRPTFDLHLFKVNGAVVDSPQAPAAPAPEGRSVALGRPGGDRPDSPQAPAAPAPEGRSVALGRPGGDRDDGKTVRLWAQDHEGWLTMDAIATLR